MHIGIALPTAVPGTSGLLLMEWTRKADAGSFSSVTVLDHMTAESYEPFTVLAAAAALTQRVRLAIILPAGSLRTTPLLARVTTSIDALSQGRLIVGLALGAHPQSYAALGIDPPSHGKLLTGQLSALRALWNERPLGPKPVQQGGPPLLLAGPGEQVAARIALVADGFITGQDAQHFAHAAEQVRAAWSAAGRAGQPQLWVLGHFALGEDATEAGRRYLRASFAFAGPAFTQGLVAQLLASSDAIMHRLYAFEEAGCDTFVFCPTVADLAQLDRLITVLHGGRQVWSIHRHSPGSRRLPRTAWLLISLLKEHYPVWRLDLPRVAKQASHIARLPERLTGGWMQTTSSPWLNVRYPPKAAAPLEWCPLQKPVRRVRWDHPVQPERCFLKECAKLLLGALASTLFHQHMQIEQLGKRPLLSWQDQLFRDQHLAL